MVKSKISKVIIKLYCNCESFEQLIVVTNSIRKHIKIYCQVEKLRSNFWCRKQNRKTLYRPH